VSGSPGTTEQLGIKLDAARAAFDKAQQQFRSYSGVRRLQDPDGFAKSQSEVQQAKDARDILQQQYEQEMSTSPSAQPYTLGSSMAQGRPTIDIAGAETEPRLPEVQALPPVEPEIDSEVVDPMLAAARNAQDVPAPAPSGIMGASQAGAPSTPSVSAFDQFKASIPRGEMEPAQQTLLKDMQARLEEKMGRAEGQENTSIYDALLTAGLAMMGGTSLADGIARAAQTGGATFLAGKKDAQKAVETAENAEIAFRQYEMEVMKGNDKAAADLFDKFNKNIIDLKQIDASYARTEAMGSDTNITRLLSQSRLLEEQINKNNTAVRNNAKYKGKLDAFNKQMEQFPLSASDQAKYNTLLSDIAADAADRNKSVQQQLDNVNSRITGSSGGSGDSGGSGGFTYRGTVESKE
jgi:hypothetical protein